MLIYDRNIVMEGGTRLEEELISKKELLEQYQISYGALYRWKRMGLIPEGWFIKQSSYTGQETFFPKEQMLARVQAILEAKDRYSLEELAKILSPEAVDVPLAPRELWEWGEIGPDLLAAAEAAAPPAALKGKKVIQKKRIIGGPSLSATRAGPPVLQARYRRRPPCTQPYFVCCRRRAVPENPVSRCFCMPPASLRQYSCAACRAFRSPAGLFPPGVTKR